MLADMLLTTHFMMLVMLTIWRLPLIAVVAFYFFFAPIEATYWSSTLEKIPTGAGAAPLQRLMLHEPCWDALAAHSIQSNSVQCRRSGRLFGP